MATGEAILCPECEGAGNLPCDPVECQADDCKGLTPCNTCGGGGTCSREEAIGACRGGEAELERWLAEHPAPATPEPRP